MHRTYLSKDDWMLAKRLFIDFCILCSSPILPSSSFMGILEHENHWVTSKEEFCDVSLFLHGVGFLSMRPSWYFCPHLQDVLQDHVHVTIKRSDSCENFAIVTKSDEHLCVGFDCFEEQRERTLREGIFGSYFLFFFFHSLCYLCLLFFLPNISWV